MSLLYKILFFIFLLHTQKSVAQVQYADIVIDSFYSGVVSQFSSFYGVDQSGDLTLVNPSICLGNNPWFVSLPKGSYVTVGFTDNAIFDAPNQMDIFIQEIGSGQELADIFVSSDMGISFTYFGKINGGTTNSIDLADIGYTGLVNAIKIVGLDNNGSAPGFDLVRIYGIEGANCEADATIELPLICKDSTLNLSQYSDGFWINNGIRDTQFAAIDTGLFQLIHIIEDDFSPCPNDTAIVEIHVAPCDCSGLPYGEKEMDICGKCLFQTDSLFDISCLDCAGIPFGESIVDFCQHCILPDNTEACTKENLFYIANAFSPNGDGLNDFFGLKVRAGVIGELVDFSIYDRWGSVVHHKKNIPLRSRKHRWDGRAHNKKAPVGVYIYSFKIQLEGGESLQFAGDITLVH